MSKRRENQKNRVVLMKPGLTERDWKTIEKLIEDKKPIEDPKEMSALNLPDVSDPREWTCAGCGDPLSFTHLAMETAVTTAGSMRVVRMQFWLCDECSQRAKKVLLNKVRTAKAVVNG